MTMRSTGKMIKLRRGTQDLLERRGMAANPGMLPPERHTDGIKAAGSAPYLGDIAFTHGGRRAVGSATPLTGSAHHAELPGHRHRGAEKHSAH
ncbi:hypothetical protein CFP65_3374 [Kitasatospora sp. MMS16-BH015]|uniref:hypothetical protein n=1 Tax=Kitasatospora sp. MMS16-BH015 TaxID=2018025 RepID=UPI000CA34922|nr:hypothetical protein [Kitasatospora sp. MMS16-BH015]AUG78170.1 hypothetical protein CFP65_3374 [Kitasatospora sp. MMS16-BH015]